MKIREEAEVVQGEVEAIEIDKIVKKKVKQANILLKTKDMEAVYFLGTRMTKMIQ